MGYQKLEKDVGYQVLRRNWEGEGELKDVVDVVYKNSKRHVWGMKSKNF